MPSKAARRTIWIFVTAALVLLALVALVPWVASTQIVRNRIAQEMSAWTGYRVEFGGAPRIDVWPSFKAVLHDVTFREWGKAEDPAVLASERIEIDLSAIAALRGEVVFSRVTLVRPLLRVTEKGGMLALPAAPGGGRIAGAVATARTQVEANPSQPDLQSLPGHALGAILFSDGRIVSGVPGAETEIVSSVTGQIGWPALNRQMTLSAKGIWRGETVGLDLSIAQPLALFAGGPSPLSAALVSPPLNASFAGSTTLSNAAFFNGKVEIATPSLRRALEWSRTDIAPGTAVGAIAVTGQLVGDPQRLKLEQARIALDGNQGSGSLELALAGPVPAISGTLAFESLNLGSFLRAFTPLPGQSGWSGEIDTGFTSQINLDLRLSAAKATAGAFSLSQVAATTQVKDGLAAFDISDATAFGGTIQVGFRIDRRENGNEGEIRLLASDVDMGLIAKAANLTGPAPQAKGMASVILKGPVLAWDTLFSNANGSISLKLGAGSIAGIDLAGFLAKAKAGGFFSLKEVSGGNLPIAEAELKATVSGGVARLDLARAVSGDYAISLGGIVPYIGRGLALSGLVAPREIGQQAEATGSIVAFFVGGSWNAPFVSPIFQPATAE